MSLTRALRRDRTLRVIGFDDAPFERGGSARVHVAGVVCAETRFEGMVWTHVVQDGWNATDRVISALEDSKFLPQLHCILFDGIAFGGFNVLDLPRVHAELERPCIAVMRRAPDFESIERALSHLTRPARRLSTMRSAGEVHAGAGCHFQTVGASPDEARDVLERVTDTGCIPEAIRLAHLIGSAVVTGESGRRA